MNNHSELKITLDLLKIGAILTGPDNKILFLNDYLVKFTELYVYQNLTLNDLFEVFDGDKIVNPVSICGEPEIAISGIIYEKEPLLITAKNSKSKIVSIRSFKEKRLLEMGVHNLILIEDVEEKNEIERMKIDFSSQAVHILRTPLSIIRNNLDSLKKSQGYENLSESEVKNLIEIEYGAEKLLNLAQNLVTINEISNERVELNLSDSSVTSIIETAINETNPIKEKTGNNILVVTPIYDLPNVKVDTLKIVSVIKGILTNSYKHTSFGEIKVQISKDTKNIIVQIEDNGEGISDTGLRFIFTKFYHSKKDPLAMEQGLGIGLYYCKKVMDAHLGEISILSKKNQGTVVTLKFKI